MNILIYRHDEEEINAMTFTDLRSAVDFMKARAEEEGFPLSSYIIKPQDDVE